MNFGFNLRDLGPLFIDLLGKPERLALRAACRDGRLVVDRAIGTVAVRRLAELDQFATFVDGVLSRGGRPVNLLIHTYNQHGATVDPALAVLALFVQHQQIIPAQRRQHLVPAPSLTHITLQVPFTSLALPPAVRSAAPHLTSLSLPGAGVYTTSPGLHHLITACAPTLTSLTLGDEDLHSVPQPLADAITACTRLQHLQFRIRCNGPSDSEDDSDDDAALDDNAPRTAVHLVVRMATVIGALPSLRSLDLHINGDLGREVLEDEDVESLEDAIGSLTQLTSLDINCPFGLAALQPLQNLVKLTKFYNYEDELVDVQHLSHLTYLQLDGVKASLDGCTELPASLRELHLQCSMTPRQLLQLAPGLTRLSFMTIRVTLPAAAAGGADGVADRGVSGSGSGGGCDEEEGPGQAGGGAFDELVQAAGLLHGRYDSSKGLAIEVGTSGGRRLVARDGFARLFAALAPLGLWKLVLSGCVLEVADVAALVEQLPQLEELDLMCVVRPDAVPLLSRLPRLRILCVRLLTGLGETEWTAASVSTAFMAVVLDAPGLELVCVFAGLEAEQVGVEDFMKAVERFRRLGAVIQAGVEGLRQRLSQMGRDPQLVVGMRGSFG